MHGDAPEQPDPAVSAYRIERLVGAGGAAAVYEAWRLGPDGPEERVACKVMHPERRGARQRSQVRQEAMLGLRFTAGHPYLVVTDAVLVDVPDEPPEQVAGRASHDESRPRSAGAGRSLGWRVIAGMCLLVLAVLPDDGARVEPPPAEWTPPSEAPGPVPGPMPVPAPPVAPAPVTPVEPSRAAEHAAGPHRKLIEAPRGVQHPGPPRARWRSAPHVSETPPWGLR